MTAYEKAAVALAKHRRQAKDYKLTDQARADHKAAVAYYESIPSGLSAFASWKQFRGSFANTFASRVHNS